MQQSPVSRRGRDCTILSCEPSWAGRLAGASQSSLPWHERDAADECGLWHTQSMSAPGIVAEVKQVLYHWWHGGEPDVGASHFGVSVQVLIGSTDSDLADSFDCILLSPSMFAEQFSVAQWGSGFSENVLPGGEVLPLHGVWLLKAWSPGAFEAAVDRLVMAMSPGPDFQSVAARIGRHLPWEYDYKHDDEMNTRSGLARLELSFWHDEPMT